MKLYKIRDKKTGLFSTGGKNPDWTKNGKTWSSIGSLKSHFTNINRSWCYRKGQSKYGLNAFTDIYKDSEVIELEITEGKLLSIDEFVELNNLNRGE